MGVVNVSNVFRTCFFCVLCCAHWAWSDGIELLNGDRISGKLIEVTDEFVVIATDYAGELRVPREYIALIERDDREDGVVVPEPVAEVLADEEMEETEEKRWSGVLDSGLSVRSGQTDTLDSHMALELVRKTPNHTLTLNFDAAYGEVDSRLDTQQARGAAKWQTYLNDRFYYFFIGSLEHDKARRLQARASAGGGVGYGIISTERTKLDIDIGLEYSRERWENFGAGGRNAVKRGTRLAAFVRLQQLATGLLTGAIPGDLTAVFSGIGLVRSGLNPNVLEEIREEDHINLRLSAALKQRVFLESKLSDSLTFLPNLDEPGEFRVRNDLVLTTPLTEKLSLRFGLKTEYDSDPGRGNIEKLDNALITGLRWEF